jgi:flavin reductase (DIM6/NTAB) family NADH-FMN oxidoreductase RutF
MSFTDREFRDALGHFATGVAIITAKVDGTLLGTTVSSFNSVSLSPPLVLFSLAQSALARPLWLQATHFAVSVLREDQKELSNRFAKAGTDKWHDVSPEFGVSGAPLLRGSLAVFECETYAVHDGGDHDIIIGKVQSFTRNTGSPLVFHGGRYRSLHQDRPLDTPPDADVWLHGW